MCEVHRHAEIRRTRIGDRQQSRGCVAQQTLGTRFVGLVLNADLAFAIVLGDLAYAFNLPVPRLGIVELEIVVETILAQPNCHQLNTHGARCINAALGEVNRFPPHSLVRICEGATLEPWVGVVSHG